jgi:hypothetical protein
MRARTLGAAFVSVFAAVSALAATASPPASTNDVIILTHNALTLGFGSELISGQLVVNDPGGVATVKGGFVGIPPTQLVTDELVIRAGPRFKPEFYDLFATPPVTGPYTVDDYGPVAASLPLFTFPTVPVATPGTDACPKPGRIPGKCVISRRDGALTLQPGNYGDISVRLGGVLYLAGGTYNVNSIRVGSVARLYFNTTTTINVLSHVVFGFQSVVGPASSTTSGRCVVMNVDSGNFVGDAVRFGPRANVTATINAPGSSARIGRFAVFSGNLAADSATVWMGSVLEALPDLAGSCP